MLMLEGRSTAILDASDTQAMGVMDAARELGFDVPGELSVVGFDDVEMNECVGLATIRQPFEDSGRRAAGILMEAVASPDRDVTCEQMPLELVVRETTRG